MAILEVFKQLLGLNAKILRLILKSTHFLVFLSPESRDKNFCVFLNLGVWTILDFCILLLAFCPLLTRLKSARSK